MVLNVFFHSSSSPPSSPSLSTSSSTETRAVEESMEVDSCSPLSASKSSVEALENVVADGSDSLDRCMICLEKFHVGIEVVTRMPCFHVYHGNCIVRWLQTSHFCPICRFQMPTD
ncbi:uncharacterized protein LOC132300978 [Cornus florida]|uniref:uncharacterized protein LOC132300978 n=1 Tax=Cornus florida TaxID=4283 RepID=UPI0028974284|nr:uncharacterized protein LOC132300978 [Cornus florida]